MSLDTPTGDHVASDGLWRIASRWWPIVSHVESNDKSHALEPTQKFVLRWSERCLCLCVCYVCGAATTRWIIYSVCSLSWLTADQDGFRWLAVDSLRSFRRWTRRYIHKIIVCLVELAITTSGSSPRTHIRLCIQNTILQGKQLSPTVFSPSKRFCIVCVRKLKLGSICEASKSSTWSFYFIVILFGILSI